MHRRRELPLELRQQAENVVHHLHRVGARLALDGEDHPPRAAEPGIGLVVLHAVEDVAQFLQAHRHAVAPRHYHGTVRRRVHQLPARLHRKRLLGAVKLPGRQIHVALLDRVLNVVDAQVARRQRIRIEIHPHRVLLAAIHDHARNAAHHRDALRKHRLGVFVHGVEGQRLGGERKVQHRLLGRIRLLIGGRPRHVGRQASARLRDGRLDVLGGRVDVALQSELHGDVRSALRIGRAHLLHARDGRELALERRGHRGSHRLGAGARQRRGDLDGRVVHAGQRRHRQRAKTHDSEQKNREGRKRRHHRPFNENAREVHG